MLPLHDTGGWSKPKLLGWNTSYITSVLGILNILEVIICIMCIHLMNISCRPAYSLSVGGFVGSPEDVNFYVINSASLMVTMTLFVCFVISQSSVMLAERTVVVVVFWLVSASAQFITGLSLFFTNIDVLFEDTKPEMSTKFASSILGLFNSILYLSTTIICYAVLQHRWLQV